MGTKSLIDSQYCASSLPKPCIKRIFYF
uniref:Uncharacterized protein n=1 Tax=Moniliophthora roreri TaxID=221103 RepID=A0A0W0G2C0_MONRR